ncbi:hypothetical protein E5Q_01003 [Mixia osmundae IAM 14324]|uniref:BZIP domain-containing protein n=1 Tax=Mixia osmundae (strain CBS 9802 / IAM 14324 / JCM 22182 / KY 12970) TaxID=764103 RepID=G7DUU2_MIXOS|nr:hypothetical protein E5Q_01003 [Mixia osmundae IAM 14324]
MASWFDPRLAELNLLPTPDNSPPVGLTENVTPEALSYPIPSDLLDYSLHQWSNTQFSSGFDADSPVSPTYASPSLVGSGADFIYSQASPEVPEQQSSRDIDTGLFHQQADQMPVYADLQNTVNSVQSRKRTRDGASSLTAARSTLTPGSTTLHIPTAPRADTLASVAPVDYDRLDAATLNAYLADHGATRSIKSFRPTHSRAPSQVSETDRISPAASLIDRSLGSHSTGVGTVAPLAGNTSNAVSPSGAITTVLPSGVTLVTHPRMSEEAIAAANAAAVEEDRRRRNTAASARFRIKKKQREAALEEDAKMLKARIDELSQELQEVRSENACLRDLLLSKNKNECAVMNGHDKRESPIIYTHDDEFVAGHHKTLGFYVTCIFPAGFVWAITPACWLFLGWHFFISPNRAAPHNAFYTFCFYHAICEALFSLFYQYLCWKGNQPAQPVQLDEAHIRGILLECLSTGIQKETVNGRRPRTTEPDFTKVTDESAAQLRKKLRSWFAGAPYSSIREDNVREWLAWAMGGVTLEDARKDPQTMRLIEETLTWVQPRLKSRVPPGYNPDIRCLKLTLDKLQVMSRPLGYYVVCSSVTLLMYAWLVLFRGFRFRHSHGLEFLVKPATSSDAPGVEKRKLPVCFLHGLGIGLGQYVEFLRHLARSDKEVIILLQPNISALIWHPRFLSPPDKHEHVAAIKDICARMDIKKMTVVAHSNGTMVLGWLLRGAPELCTRTVLVDPVSLLLHEADVCYTFVYKPWQTGLQVLLGYFVARELGNAHTIGRDFQWTDMLLWEHELPDVSPENLHIVLGDSDFLIDPVSIVRYLKECGIVDEAITLCRGYNHGQALIVDSDGMRTVLSHM